MNKKIKKVFMYIFSMTIVMMTPCLVSAHSLTPWAALYTPERAGGNFQFSIGDFYHPPTNYVDYYFENSVARNNFLYSFSDGRDEWGGMIITNETTFLDRAIFKIQYNPNIAASTAAYVECVSPSVGHYGPGEISTKMVVGNITNYSQKNQAQVFAHELGHAFGINDLYQVNDNLSSIYSNTYRYPSATQMDRNALYICLDIPWYYMSGPDRRAKYQKAPGVWARNESIEILGKLYTFDADGYVIN